MKISNLIRKTAFSLSLFILMFNGVAAEQLTAFASDGCSHFPDGTPSQPDLWCDCCINHDIAYWQGGNREQKNLADQALRECVLTKTGNNLLADTMYYGASLGGSPVFPMWYRWGYGWRYGRGFQSLNDYEIQLVTEKLHYYKQASTNLSCDFEHPLQVEAKDKFQKLMDHFE